MKNQVTAQPVPASAFHIGALEPAGANSKFLPITVDDKYSPAHKYLVKPTGLNSKPGCQDQELYGLTTSTENNKQVVKFLVSDNETDGCLKYGSTHTVSAASLDSNGNWTAFGASLSFTVPNS